MRERGRVWMGRDSVWMRMEEIGEMYNVLGWYVGKGVKGILKEGIVKEEGVGGDVRKKEGMRYDVYRVEVVIGVGLGIERIERRGFGELMMEWVMGRERRGSKVVCMFRENGMG